MGFDTMAFYVPNTLDWAAGSREPFEMLEKITPVFENNLEITGSVGPLFLLGRQPSKECIRSVLLFLPLLQSSSDPLLETL